MRMLTERSVAETAAQLERKINQQTCEETIVKFNVHMMQSLIEKLDSEKARNMALKDQLKVDFMEWQVRITEKLEAAPELKGGRVPAFGKEPPITS